MPLPSRIVTVPVAFATATSSLPSPLKSPAPRAVGDRPNGDAPARLSRPVPSPFRTTTLPLSLATARSSFPSALKSPAAAGPGWRPFVEVGDPGARARPPSPSPSITDTLPLLKLTTATSVLASPLKSPTVAETGRASPVGKGDFAAAVNPPAPSPSSTETFLLPSLAATRSCLPSPLRSAIATAEGFFPPVGTWEAGAWESDSATATEQHHDLAADGIRDHGIVAPVAVQVSQRQRAGRARARERRARRLREARCGCGHRRERLYARERRDRKQTGDQPGSDPSHP